MKINKKITLKLSFWILMILVLLGTNSCAPSYVPNVLNTPIFSEKGELQAAIYTGTSGVDVQVAYAPTNHLGLMMNGSFADSESSTNSDFHQHTFLEVGGGYFQKMGNKGVLEAYGGLGFGSIRANYDNDAWTSTADVNNARIFLQPSIGFTTNLFDGSFATRIAYVHLDQNSNSESALFFEPVATARLGYKNVKAVAQMGLSLPFEENVVFDYQPFLITLGIHGRLNMGK